MKRPRVARHGEPLPLHGVLVVRQPRTPWGQPWPQADLLIWEKTSDGQVRLREGIVSIEMDPGEWWVNGELLHYARTWDDMERWAGQQTGLFDGQRVCLIPAAGPREGEV